MKNKTMAWIFSDSAFDDSKTIIVQTDENTVFEKTKIGDTIYYMVKHKTYEQWAMWYSMLANRIDGPRDYYDHNQVMYFDKQLHNKLSKLKVTKAK